MEARQTLENYIADRGPIIDDLETTATKICVIERDEITSNPSCENDSEECTRTHSWIKKLISLAKPVSKEKKSSSVNAFLFETFIPDLERIGKEFPLWTGAAIPKAQGTKHATTAYQEGFFASQRTRVFENVPLPCAANRFLKVFIDYLRSGTSIVASKLKHVNHHANAITQISIPSTTEIVDSIKSPSVLSNGNFLDDSDYECQEHWFGLKNDIKPFLRDDEDYIIPIPIKKQTNQTSSEILSELLGLNRCNGGDLNGENSPLLNIRLNSSLPDTTLNDSPALSSTLISALEEKVTFSEVNTLPKPVEPSYYFKAYPEGRIIKSGIVSTKITRQRGYLLPNGNNCRVLKIDGVAISVQNTCLFDSSVVQILHYGAIDYSQYGSAIQLSKNKTLQFVSNFVKNGLTTDILKDRIQILKEIYDLKKVENATSLSPYILNTYDSVQALWTKLFLKMNSNEPSGFKKYVCSNPKCKGEKQINLPLLTVNSKIIRRYGGFRSLEKALDYYPKIYNI